MIVEIKPIDKEKWHGYKSENSFSRPVKIYPAIDHETRTYKTGLASADVVKLKKQKVPYDLSNEYSRYSAHELWDSPEISIKLENHTIRLNTDIPIDFIRYKYILEHPIVANYLTDFEDGKYPEATHYIVNSPDVIKKKASIVEIRKKVYKMLDSTDKAKKVMVVTLIEGKKASEFDDNTLEVTLDNLAQNKPKEVYDILNKDGDKIEAEYVIREALRKRILTRKKGGIYFMDLKLGSYEEDAVLYLLDKENKELYDRIKEQAIN